MLEERIDWEEKDKVFMILSSPWQADPEEQTATLSKWLLGQTMPLPKHQLQEVDRNHPCHASIHTSVTVCEVEAVGLAVCASLMRFADGCAMRFTLL